MAADEVGCVLQSADVFVGAGGLALGVSKSGFKHVVVFDVNRAACETLRQNHRKSRSIAHEWKVIEKDITKVHFSDYAGRIDLLSGGPPCQPFSQGGRHRGRADIRDCFPQFIRAVREIQPQAFIIENVKGLTRQKFSNYFQYLLLQLRLPTELRNHREKWKEHCSRLERLHTGGNSDGLQYNVIYKTLNATDYGVPQNRERVFIVGVRSDIGLEYSFPLPTHSREALIRKQWITGEYWDRHRVSKKRFPEHLRPADSAIDRIREKKPRSLGKPWRTVRDAFRRLPRVGIGIGQSSSKIANHYLNDGARLYLGHNGSCLDLPSKTVKAGYHGVPGGENIVCLDDGSARYFSVRECARLQTFPDDWEFSGTWTSAMWQVGNAVPVHLAQVLVAPLAEALDAKNRLPTVAKASRPSAGRSANAPKCAKRASRSA
ncbi:MAG: DNA cytosine methyltransferase [Planctomycetes bacterium]|nr:DNA cytosine methyltransferase [Planctomycetota bacterium]